MRDIRLSGSGEGPSWATARPTLQAMEIIEDEGIRHEVTHFPCCLQEIFRQLPLTDPDTLFEELLQDLPAESVQLARAFKAFVRAKKVKTPAQLLRMVFFYGGLDTPWREVAGTLTALYPSMTAQSVAERLRACGPWVQARLRQMVPQGRRGAPALGAALCGHRRAQYASPRRDRHGASPAPRDGLGLLAVARGVGPRCPYRRNAHALHLRSGRCRGSGSAALPRAKACMRRSRRGPPSWYGSIPAVWS